MSYQNQSDKDHLDIIIGPPRRDKLIDSIHDYAEKHNMSMDEAWSKHIENNADHLMKPFLAEDSFSDIFTNFLGEEIYAQDYFLSHYFGAFSTNGMLMARIKNPEDRHKYAAPALNFQSKNLLDGYGNPINIRKFNSTKRQHIQRVFAIIFDASWVHATISYGYTPIEKETV
tara:strand:- start:38 stop:553 length:516 start_codon:yes stop_codon:yes gene_type:complete